MENTRSSLKQDTLAIKEKEAAAMLNISDALLGSYRQSGIGPRYIKLPSGAVRYRVSDLVEFLDKHTVPHSVAAQTKEGEV